MLISRRGLTAAGLALAAVGGLGVTSTMTAGAAQIAGPRPAAVPPDLTADLVTPPPPLPGAGAAGNQSAAARSASVAGTGAPAPEPAPGESTHAYAPKGMPGRVAAAPSTTGSRFGAQVRSLAAPTAPAVPGHGAVFFYAQASQDAVTEGTYATMTIGKPTVGTDAHHSLAEIAAQTVVGEPGGEQPVEHGVEVGWTVDRKLNGDDKPRLFVYHWVDGKVTCYNTCGFVPFKPAPPAAQPGAPKGEEPAVIKPGAALPVGEAKRFGIRQYEGGWWIWYDTAWIGYFPNSLWQGRFTRTEVVQWWGEVAAVNAQKPCADMGTGAAASEAGAAEIRRINLINGPAVNIVSGTRGGFYSVKQVGNNAIRFGGTGPCPA